MLHLLGKEQVYSVIKWNFFSPWIVNAGQNMFYYDFY